MQSEQQLTFNPFVRDLVKELIDLISGMFHFSSDLIAVTEGIHATGTFDDFTGPLVDLISRFHESIAGFSRVAEKLVGIRKEEP